MINRDLWPQSDGIYQRHTLTVPIAAEPGVLTRLVKLQAIVTEVSEVIEGHSAIEYWTLTRGEVNHVVS